VEEEVGFAQHGRQRVMARSPVPARVVPFQGPFLIPVTLEHSGNHVQGVALGPLRQPLHLLLGQGFEEALDLAHAKLAKQIADRGVSGKPLHAEQRMQRLIAA
jgi:hypothetical protein